MPPIELLPAESIEHGTLHQCLVERYSRPKVVWDGLTKSLQSGMALQVDGT